MVGKLSIQSAADDCARRIGRQIDGQAEAERAVDPGLNSRACPVVLDDLAIPVRKLIGDHVNENFEQVLVRSCSE